MAAQNWDRAIGHVLAFEGGFADRSDPHKYPHPEYVNHGITYGTYKHYHPEATKETIKNLTDEQAKQFYSDTFRKEIGFDTLQSGLDVVLLHAAVMFGVHGSQTLLNDAKGDWGFLVVLMMHNKMHRGEKDWHYMQGWSDRFKAVYELARELSIK